LGTVEEFFEVLTWAQLDIHRKPCGLLNVCHYYDDLISFLNRSVEQQFIRPEHRAMVLVERDPGHLLNHFETYRSPKIDKAEWIISLNSV
jgi:predicted Rossmann-fold nucleotide-binding protein